MSDQDREVLKGALREAEISDVKLETPSTNMRASGSCAEGCQGGCLACCESGEANR